MWRTDLRGQKRSEETSEEATRPASERQGGCHQDGRLKVMKAEKSLDLF